MQQLLSNPKFRNTAGLIITLALLTGFIFARAIHSITLLFVGLYWVVYRKETVWMWKTKWFWSLLAVLLCVPIFDLINGGIVDNGFFIKLSLPLYALFFFAWNPDKRYISYANRSVFIIFFLLAVETLIRYFTNTELIHNDYKVAKVLSIGVYSDHIRISVFMALSCLLALYELTHNCKTKTYKTLLLGYLAFQVLFLHFLTARTGLVVLYVSMITYFLFFIVKKKAVAAIAFIAIFAALPFVSMKVFPSFYNRMGYMFWDKGHYQKMEYHAGSSDGFRYYSLLAGMDIFKKNMADGVGFHHLKEVSRQWLKAKFPQIKDEELIQPSSQLIIYAAAGGLVALIVLITFMVMPFFDKRLLTNDIFLSIYLGLLTTFIFELLLENQYGTFVFGFFTYWAYFLAIRSSHGSEKQVHNEI